MSVLRYGPNSLRYIPFPTKITSLINTRGLVDSDSPENHHNNRRNSESQRWPKTFWAVYVNSECARIWCNRLKHYVVLHISVLIQGNRTVRGSCQDVHHCRALHLEGHGKFPTRTVSRGRGRTALPLNYGSTAVATRLPPKYNGSTAGKHASVFISVEQWLSSSFL